VRACDRPAGLDRVAGGLRRARAWGADRLRARAGDAPRLGALSGRGQDRPPRQLRARRHGAHPRAAAALARGLGRDARAAAGAGRLWRRSRPRREPHREPAQGHAARRRPGAGAGSRSQARPPVARALLARYPTPTALRAAGRRRLTPLAKRHAPRIGARLVDEIQAALAAQTITVPAEETTGRVIRELAEELDRLADRRDRLAQEIEQTFSGHPQAPVLLSIPGIGARTGARILTEIGDINRFPTAGHLAAYAGLAPVTRQSGRTINGETRSRRGNHRLKNAIWLSAFCSLHHHRSRDYYARKRSEGKQHNAAIVCLARRRCDVIHAMLRTGLSYGELPGPAAPAPKPEVALAA
jgi:transposase